MLFKSISSNFLIWIIFFITEQIADKVPNVPKLINKWDGEDEDDEVKVKLKIVFI